MIAALIIVAMVLNGLTFGMAGLYLAVAESETQASRNVATIMAVGAGMSFALFLAILLGASA